MNPFADLSREIVDRPGTPSEDGLKRLAIKQVPPALERTAPVFVCVAEQMEEPVVLVKAPEAPKSPAPKVIAWRNTEAMVLVHGITPSCIGTLFRQRLEFFEI